MRSSPLPGDVVPRFRPAAASIGPLGSLVALALAVSHCSGGPSGPAIPTCGPLDYVVAPGTPESASVGATYTVPFQFEGDRIYFASGNGIYTADSGLPHLAASLPSHVETRPDGTSVALKLNIGAFWIEPSRFIAASPDGVWSLPRDGMAATLITSFASHTEIFVSARDDASLYLVAIDESQGWRLQRAPLAGGPVDEIATFSTESAPDALYVDGSRLYVVAGRTINAYAKGASGLSRIPERVPLSSFYSALGFDGTSFYVTRTRDPGSSMYIDRDALDGNSTHAWASHDPVLDAEESASASDGVYVAGWVYHPGTTPDAKHQGIVRIAADGATSVLGCASSSNVLLMKLGVGSKSVYAYVYGDARGWGIARFPR